MLDKDIQYALRKVCYELMQTMKSSFVIYVPDNAARESAIMDFLWDDENRDILFMKNWLLNHCGLPKNSIEEIYIQCEHYWESDGYFIDEFKDF
ncbi:hypothetical protein [Paenibacillus bovis]|uniref:Uncharacterized protein n=1 Tax=Paenibacillus bovis TaxID=1616788 RepID=A0A172ZJL2_9BACL|nr:hypothetical protein [Paenibacillus bovis]ANF97835.1 hypothetical protein AR543_18660 [Paenibacillus bovis]